MTMRSVPVSWMFDWLENIAPSALTMPGDVSGFQIGNPEGDVKRVHIALDASPAAIHAACDADVDLLLTHHALLYRPLHRIDTSTQRGQTLVRALASGLTIVNAHTNLDIAIGGVNDVLASLFALRNVVGLDTSVLPAHRAGLVLDSRLGMGRIGYLAVPMTLAQFADDVRQRLGLPHIRYGGSASHAVQCVAVVGGSGGNLASLARQMGADVLVTADCDHHDVADAWDYGLAIIDATHAALEIPVLSTMATRLTADLQAAGYVQVEVAVSPVVADPFTWL